MPNTKQFDPAANQILTHLRSNGPCGTVSFYKGNDSVTNGFLKCALMRLRYDGIIILGADQKWRPAR